MLERIPATFELATLALAISLALGVPLGVYAALNRGRWVAGALMTASLVGVSLPSFVVGILLIFAFAVSLWRHRGRAAARSFCPARPVAAARRSPRLLTSRQRRSDDQRPKWTIMGGWPDVL